MHAMTLELKSAQTILASVLTPKKQEIAHLDVEKVLQTILASVYTPHMETTHLKKWLPLDAFLRC